MPQTALILNLIAAKTAEHSAADKTTGILDSQDALRHFVGDAGESSYAIARVVMNVVDWILGIFGLEHNRTIVTFLYAAVVLGIALLVGWVAQWLIFSMLRLIAKRWDTDTYHQLTSVKFFHKLCRMIPALVFLILIQFTLSAHDSLSSFLTKATLIYVVIVTCIALSALIVALWMHIDTRANKRKLPLKGLAQLAKGFVWAVAAIIIIAIIVDKSPASLLAGLGAFAAVLMLIFKDSILGIVAGVQLSENDMLRVGDWIKVDGTSANGTVLDVSLSSVKVLNWDKTITTVPPYSLVSGSFQNYRTMSESGTRRICRTYFIDTDTVRFCTPDMLESFKEIPFMRDYITKKMAQRAAGKVQDVNNSDGLPDGTIDTNLGLFRAYLKMYLTANEHISKQDFCFVNTLQQTNGGIPLQVYCFTDTSAWVAYEAIQSAIFEHIAAILPQFGLYAFENPSSRDTVNEGYLEASGNPANLYGLPYPFMPGIDGHPGQSPFAAQNK